MFLTDSTTDYDQIFSLNGKTSQKNEKTKNKNSN